MSWLLVESINKRVGPKDELWFLGDLSFGNEQNTLEILKSINCENINLVMGNHDQLISKSAKVRAEFNQIEVYKEINHNHQRYVLFHFPMREWNRMHHGAIHLYGHVHGHLPGIGRSMDVGVDARPDRLMEPWSIDEIYDQLKDKEILPHNGRFAT